MIASTTFLAAVVVAGAGTYLIRAAPLAGASRLVDLPPRAQRALRLIPPAVFAALVVPGVIRPDGELDLLGPRLVAALVATVVGWRTRNVALTVVVGVALLTALQQIG